MKTILAVLVTFGCAGLASAQGTPTIRLFAPQAISAAQVPAIPGIDLGSPTPVYGNSTYVPGSSAYAQAPAPTPEAYGSPVIAMPQGSVTSTNGLLPCPTELYTNVKVFNARKIPLCAKPTIVQIPDPCNKCVCVNIQVCVPQCECPPKVLVTRCGNRVKLDYGKYEVVIVSHRHCVTVHYHG